MNKEIIICLFIVFFIIFISVITEKYSDYTIDTLNSTLNGFKYYLLNENINDDEIKNKINEIMKMWKDKYEILSYYIEHDELEKVETELTELSSSLDTKQYEDGVGNIDRCIFILNHIKNKYIFELKNIF